MKHKMYALLIIPPAKYTYMQKMCAMLVCTMNYPLLEYKIWTRYGHFIDYKIKTQKKNLRRRLSNTSTSERIRQMHLAKPDNNGYGSGWVSSFIVDVRNHGPGPPRFMLRPARITSSTSNS